MNEEMNKTLWLAISSNIYHKKLQQTDLISPMLGLLFFLF